MIGTSTFSYFAIEYLYLSSQLGCLQGSVDIIEALFQQLISKEYHDVMHLYRNSSLALYSV